MYNGMEGELKKQPKLRKLRIAFSAVCGILCLLLIALWVWSYWRFDYVSGMLTANRQVEIFAIQGRLAIGTWVEPTYSPWTHRSNPVAESQGTVRILEDGENSFGFAFIRPSVVIPIHFHVVFASIMAVFPWLPWRFSLRTLLVASTLVAAGLGLIVAASR
jgi:hypothetical protein